MDSCPNDVPPPAKGSPVEIHSHVPTFLGSPSSTQLKRLVASERPLLSLLHATCAGGSDGFFVLRRSAEGAQNDLLSQEWGPEHWLVAFQVHFE